MNLKNKYVILLFLLTIISKSVCTENEEKATHFVMRTFSEANEELLTYNLTFNYTTNVFDEYENLLTIPGVKYLILCNEEDINKDKNERKLLTLWHVSVVKVLYSATFILIAFPVWYNQQKEKGETFCFRLDSVGWSDNANAKICDENDPNVPCPDIIILDTPQLTQRYNKKETISLNKYFRRHFLKTGISFESLINKNLYYDYNVDNNWLAMPLSADFRVLQFNITTFDYCKSKNYDLHYPPPLSNYWGEDYQKTWTWDKVFEYAEKISKCIGKPSFKIMTKYNEDLKFFIALCQSLNIPFFIDDPKYGVKQCGLRGKKNIEKLYGLKNLVENHYIEMWLNKASVDSWKNSSYPINIENPPLITYDDDLVNLELSHTDSYIYGMLYNSLFLFTTEPEIKYCYAPGGSYLGGTGAVITKGSKIPDQAFEFIEFLISDKYPYFSELNISITPFDNIYGGRCKNIPQRSKKEFCDSLIQTEGTFPYYYINKKNKTNIIYITHIKKDSERRIIINENNLKDMEFTCGSKADFKDRTIEYCGNYKIKLPVSDSETIILKSMRDIDEKENIEQTQEMICSIYDETLKVAKPMEFPYNNFNEIKELQNKAPISLLFAHLYYKHNKNLTFEEIINECCDIIDNALFPNCEGKEDIIFELADTCNEKTGSMNITYKNCKTRGNSEFPESIPCTYIPYKSTLGWILSFVSFDSVLVEIFFALVVITKRKSRCIYVSSFKFLLFFIVMSIVLTCSTNFFIGEFKKSKCIFRMWLMIIGLTFIICSYSIKSEIIISIYNNKKLTTTNVKNKSYLKYIILSVSQVVLLIIWTITHEGIVSVRDNIEKIGYFNYNSCSTGNLYILSSIFILEYALLIVSIIVSYQGRNIPDEFNESKKIFIISIFSAFQLSLCYLTTLIDIYKYEWLYILVLLLIIIISLIINFIFIGTKILMVYNIMNQTQLSGVVVVKKTSIGNNSSFTNNNNSQSV